MLHTQIPFCSSMQQRDPGKPGSADDNQQSRCLVESALRILRNHASEGDRYMRLAAQRLIADDEARAA